LKPHSHLLRFAFIFYFAFLDLARFKQEQKSRISQDAEFGPGRVKISILRGAGRIIRTQENQKRSVLPQNTV